MLDPAKSSHGLTRREVQVLRLIVEGLSDREIGERLTALGMPVDVESVLMSAAAKPGSSVGRPMVARELLRAGYVTSIQEAFDLWLASGRPAFVPRTGPSPAAPGQ